MPSPSAPETETSGHPSALPLDSSPPLTSSALLDSSPPDLFSLPPIIQQSSNMTPLPFPVDGDSDSSLLATSSTLVVPPSSDVSAALHHSPNTDILPAYLGQQTSDINLPSPSQPVANMTPPPAATRPAARDVASSAGPAPSGTMPSTEDTNEVFDFGDEFNDATQQLFSGEIWGDLNLDTNLAPQASQNPNSQESIPPWGQVSTPLAGHHPPAMPTVQGTTQERQRQQAYSHRVNREVEDFMSGSQVQDLSLPMTGMRGFYGKLMWGGNAIPCEVWYGGIQTAATTIPANAILTVSNEGPLIYPHGGGPGTVYPPLTRPEPHAAMMDPNSNGHMMGNSGSHYGPNNTRGAGELNNRPAVSSAAYMYPSQGEAPGASGTPNIGSSAPHPERTPFITSNSLATGMNSGTTVMGVGSPSNDGNGSSAARHTVPFPPGSGSMMGFSNTGTAAPTNNGGFIPQHMHRAQVVTATAHYPAQLLRNSPHPGAVWNGNRFHVQPRPNTGAPMTPHTFNFNPGSAVSNRNLQAFERMRQEGLPANNSMTFVGNGGRRGSVVLNGPGPGASLSSARSTLFPANPYQFAGAGAGEMGMGLGFGMDAVYGDFMGVSDMNFVAPVQHAQSGMVMPRTMALPIRRAAATTPVRPAKRQSNEDTGQQQRKRQRVATTSPEDGDHAQKGGEDGGNGPADGQDGQQRV